MVTENLNLVLRSIRFQFIKFDVPPSKLEDFFLKLAGKVQNLQITDSRLQTLESGVWSLKFWVQSVESKIRSLIQKTTMTVERYILTSCPNIIITNSEESTNKKWKVPKLVKISIQISTNSTRFGVNMELSAQDTRRVNNLGKTMWSTAVQEVPFSRMMILQKKQFTYVQNLL